MQLDDLRSTARDIFDQAVISAAPRTFLSGRLPRPAAHGRLILLGAGKAGASMVQAAEDHYLDDLGIAPARISGLAVTRHGYGCRTRKIPVIQAGHPVPDLFGLAGTERMLFLADSTTAEDTVVVLMSGGASANLIAPVPGLSLAEKQAMTTALLRSGAPIEDMNCLRKHLSQVKGGRLARRLAPARVVTLAVSDVPHDDLAVIGSGPTVPDPTTLADARGVVDRYRLPVSDRIRRMLNDAANETPKADDPIFRNQEVEIVLRPADALKAAVARAHKSGFEVIDLGPDVAGEARKVATAHAALALEARSSGRRVAILSGGELTVTIKGGGRGGPNQEYALALAIALNGATGIVGLACDTDGTDGGSGSQTDPAGAMVDPATLARAEKLGVDAIARLEDNDSTRFFAQAGGLVVTGPTLTNANDLRVILVDPAAA